MALDNTSSRGICWQPQLKDLHICCHLMVRQKRHSERPRQGYSLQTVQMQSEQRTNLQKAELFPTVATDEAVAEEEVRGLRNSSSEHLEKPFAHATNVETASRDEFLGNPKDEVAKGLPPGALRAKALQLWKEPKHFKLPTQPLRRQRTSERHSLQRDPAQTRRNSQK